MNPQAKEFVFNLGAKEFVPPASSSPPKPPVDDNNDDGDEDIDEDDPLWKATLQHCNGDRESAIKMLEDPDALMANPAIKAIIESGSSADDDWETDKKVESTSAAKPAAKSAAKVDDDEEAGGDDEILVEGDPREHLNLVFIGHVDAGKSTLSGSILYIMGMVDSRTIERYEREAKQRNRESWFLAFIMDTSEEERAKGKTVEVGRAHFETETNRYTILDAPGHKNYVPNMIAGAVQADVGILVISARKGEFETGFEKGGQTREHALLAKTLGVQYLVVVINKMDDPTVEWDVNRYEECVSKLKPYLKQCGYTIKRDIRFIPISALSGDNVLKEVSPEKCSWWKKYWTEGNHNTVTPSLVTTLDSLKLSGRNPDGPLRIPVLDRYFERGCVVLGKVESGTLRMDDEIIIAPTKKKAKVEGIYIGEKRVAAAKPGENVLIKFSINVEDIQKGYILCHPNNTAPACTEIVAQLALVDMLEHRPIFSPGYEAVMHVHTVEVEVTCGQLICIIDKGNKIKRPFGRQGQQVICHLILPISTCMEKFTDFPSMGRLTIRDEGKTIAIGKITDIAKKSV